MIRRKSHGMRDYIIRASEKPTADLICKLDFHHFAVGEDFISPADESMKSVLGQEFDVTVDWNMRKGLSAQLGVYVFLPTEDWQGSESDMGTFFYLILQANI